MIQSGEFKGPKTLQSGDGIYMDEKTCWLFCIILCASFSPVELYQKEELTKLFPPLPTFCQFLQEKTYLWHNTENQALLRTKIARHTTGAKG